MSRIFLSHSSKDNFAAIALRDWLRSEGWDDVFLDLDAERGIAGGERWEKALHAAASRCEAVIFLVSGSWIASDWCMREYTVARGLNKKLFATLVDAAKTIADLPSALKDTWQIVDLVGGQDMRLLSTQLPNSHEERTIGYSREGLRRLKLGLEKAGLDPRFFAWPPEHEPNRAPYRGLKPLEAADAGIFFGRDAPIVEATDRLRGLADSCARSILVILGASGAGKSSFLGAGLLPRLARDDSYFIPLAPIRPQRAALTGDTGLLGALEAAFAERTRAELRAALREGVEGIRRLFLELVSASQRRRLDDREGIRPPAVVIAIDQAEELFQTEGAEESTALLELLGELTRTDNPAAIVIFAIRSDSYDSLEHAKALEGLQQCALPLLPMPRGAYKEVIEGPARRLVEAGGKLSIEPRLTQRLLHDIEKGGGADALPLLAFTLEQLYLEYRRAGALRLTDYEAIGGFEGAINAGVERALARADGDPRIPRDRAAREKLLRRGLIPWLAGVDPDTKSPRRNVARKSDIPPEAAPLIELLVEERLLSTDTRIERDAKTKLEMRIATIEPAHEAFLRQSGLVEGWLAEDFGLLATLEGVKRAARDWDANSHADAWLAHQGQRLAEAEALDARPDIAAKLDLPDRTYLKACRKKEAAARRRAQRLQAMIYALFVSIIIGLIGWINQAYIKDQLNWYAVMRPYMLADVRPHVLTVEAERALKPGASFRECAKQCPEMIVLPAGKFIMGSPATEANRKPNEGQQHLVTIGEPFAVSKYDVTFADWDACVAVGGCPLYSDAGMGRGRKPLVHVTWDDAEAYAAWFSRMTGEPYRLLTEAEWEYAARAGTITAYYWGDRIGDGNADCTGCGAQWGKATSQVGSFAANPFGLYDMAGDVWQWVQDCYHRDYMGAPRDGSAWTGSDCTGRVVRGGSWDDVPLYLRSAARVRVTFDDRDGDLGFRLARTLAR